MGKRCYAVAQATRRGMIGQKKCAGPIDRFASNTHAEDCFATRHGGEIDGLRKLDDWQGNPHCVKAMAPGTIGYVVWLNVSFVQ